MNAQRRPGDWPVGGMVWFDPDIISQTIQETTISFLGEGEIPWRLGYFCIANSQDDPLVNKYRVQFDGEKEIILAFKLDDLSIDEQQMSAELIAASLAQLPREIVDIAPDVIAVKSGDGFASANPNYGSMCVQMSKTLRGDTAAAFVQSEHRPYAEFLAETMLHEISHAGGLDNELNGNLYRAGNDRFATDGIGNFSEWTKGWSELQLAYETARICDDSTVSYYAWQNPFSEDVAESLAVWVYLTYFNDELSQEWREYFYDKASNRLNVFDHYFLGKPLNPWIERGVSDTKYDAFTGEVVVSQLEIDGSRYDVRMEVYDLESNLLRVNSLNPSCGP